MLLGITHELRELIRFLKPTDLNLPAAKAETIIFYEHLNQILRQIEGAVSVTAKLSMICTLQSNGAYFAVCPEVKGCFTQGDTYEEAAASLQELAEITVREEAADKELQELFLSKAKIIRSLKSWSEIQLLPRVFSATRTATAHHYTSCRVWCR